MRILFMFLSSIIFFSHQSKQVPIYQQSDRIYLSYPAPIIWTDPLQPGQYKDLEIVFPADKQFKNIPSILYSTTTYEINGQNCLSQSYQVSSITVSTTKLLYRVQSQNCLIYNLYLIILAIDDPLIEVVQENVKFTSSLKTITFKGKSKIQSFSPFIAGFKGTSPSSLFISQQIEKVDDFTYQFTINQGNIEDIYFNYLVVYEDSYNSVFSPLYSFKQIIDSRKNDISALPEGIQKIEWFNDTDLADGSHILFGLKDFKIETIGNYLADIQIIIQLVKNKKINLIYYIFNKNVCQIQDINGILVQFLMKTCEAGEYMYINPINKSSECTVNCSVLDHHYYNNPLPQTLYTTQILVCSACNENCFGCVGNETDKCLDCYDGKYLDSYTQKCQDTKPVGSYCNQESVNGNTYNSCFKCHESCKECTGGGQNECLSCKTSYSTPDVYLYEGQCFYQQPNDAFCFQVL